MNIYVIVLVLTSALLYYILLKKQRREERLPRNTANLTEFTLELLTMRIREEVNEVLNSDIDVVGLDRNEIIKRKKQQSRLRRATREACLGDAGDGEFLKEYIKDILQKSLGINEQTITKVISFDNPDRMTAQEVFEYMYMIYRRIYGLHVFERLVEDYGWNEPEYDEEGRAYYCVTDADIRNAWADCEYCGEYVDMLEVLTQRCYEILYGHDAADILIMDEDIDGVSGGVGGHTRIEYNYLEELMSESPLHAGDVNSYDVIYCVFRGRLIRMRFLSFGCAKTLERVVKNIYRYNSKATLSKRNPVLNASLKNNSRVVAARPPVSDSWAFYVRKFASTDARKIESLITDRNCDRVIELLKNITKAELNFVVSGNTGGGKTTLVKSLIGYINPAYALRVIETSFELNINNLYPDRNVHVMQERGDFTVYDAIAASKKMDTDVLILGEVNEPKIAGAFIQVAQSGSRMAITTLHHETTHKLIDYLRNALVSEFGISDVRIAEKQVVDSINFDIHMVHDSTGHHYVERITEIVPYEPKALPDDPNAAAKEFYTRMLDPRLYELHDIIIFDKAAGEYRTVGEVSPYAAMRMKEACL